ncbi:hypothetical protein MTO96_019149 [Rhipicephalus appendiculatus]
MRAAAGFTTARSLCVQLGDRNGDRDCWLDSDANGPEDEDGPRQPRQETSTSFAFPPGSTAAADELNARETQQAAIASNAYSGAEDERPSSARSSEPSGHFEGRPAGKSSEKPNETLGWTPIRVGGAPTQRSRGKTRDQGRRQAFADQ